MKKIIMVLVIFISSIIFYDSYVNLSQKQYSDVINLSYKFAQENDMEVVPIDLQLSEDKQERTEQFNQVYSFLQEHSYPCFVGIVSKNIKTKYVYLPKQNKLPIYTEENKTSVYKGYKQDKIEMRGDRAEMSDFPLYLNTVAGGLDCRDQTIGGFSFVVKIYAVPVVEIIG